MAEDLSFLKLSVQGTLLALDREKCMSHDWLLSRMLTSGVPHQTLGGVPYLDVDPVSFRVILSIMQGMTDLSLEVSRISSAELALLRSTARYLCCEEIERELGTIVSEHASQLCKLEENHEAEVSKLKGEYDAEVLLLKKQIEKNQNEIKKLHAERDTLAEENELIETLVKLPKSIVMCNNYRTHRPNNRCDTTTILIGATTFDAGNNRIRCGECDNTDETEMDKLRFKKMGRSPQDLVRAVYECERLLEY